MKQIRPPLAFGTVESGVYRSGMPAPSNFSFMDTLQLRTVLLLSQEIPTKAVKTYFSDNHIKTIYLGLNSSGRSGKHLTESLVKDALEIILNSNYHPILIVCSCGLFTTGTVIGCLRRLQNWCLASILDEYRMYTASLSRYANEQFIEHFDVDIVTLPSNLPYWFTLQQSMLEKEKQLFSERQETGETYQPIKKPNDPRLAFKVYMFAPRGPLVSVKSSFTDESLIDDEDD